MRQIDVQDQFRMSVARTFSLTISGIRYRLFRSSVTVVVVSVAIAFLMNILSEGLIMGAVGRYVSRNIKEERQAPRWAARLSVPGTVEVIIQEIAASSGPPSGPDLRAASSGPPEVLTDRAGEGSGAPPSQAERRQGPSGVYAEGMRLGGLAPEEMRFYHEKAGAAARYVRYFEDLNYAPRRLLVHNARGVAIFDRLQAPEEFEAFRRELSKLKTLRFPTPTSEFRSFLDEWPRVREMTLRIQRGRSEAQAKIKASLGPRTVMEGLAEEDLSGHLLSQAVPGAVPGGGPPGQASFAEVVRDAGFALSEAEAAALAVQARRILEQRYLEETVLRPEMRRAAAAYVNVMPAEVNALTLWKLLGSRGSARWYFD